MTKYQNISINREETRQQKYSVLYSTKKTHFISNNRSL